MANSQVVARMLRNLKASRDDHVARIEEIDICIEALRQDKPARTATVNGNGHSRIKCKHGEMRKAVVAAFVHFNGMQLTGVDVAKYVDKHRPQSLRRRKGLDMQSRTKSELARMAKEGLIREVGRSGHAKVWQWVGEARVRVN